MKYILETPENLASKEAVTLSVNLEEGVFRVYADGDLIYRLRKDGTSTCWKQKDNADDEDFDHEISPRGE